MTEELPLLPDDMRPVLLDFLKRQSTLALATAGLADGRPQVAPLFFASDEHLNLYWISDPDSRHSRNITDWNDAAATVFTETWEYSAIKGVQIEGDAYDVTDQAERERALALYRAKFPFVNEKFDALIQESVIYVLRPRWVRWIDNERKFGYRKEFRIAQDSSNGDTE